MRSVKQRVLAALLTAAMFCTYIVPAYAASNAEPVGDAAGQTQYNYEELDKGPMQTTAEANSEEDPGDGELINKNKDGLAKAAFDGKTDRCWHSNYQFGDEQTSMPESCNFSIEWDLVAKGADPVSVGQLKYQTKTPSQTNGVWKTIEILATVNGQPQRVFQGDIAVENGAATVTFDPVNATHMKVVITQTLGDTADYGKGMNHNKYAAAGEITVYKATAVPTNERTGRDVNFYAYVDGQLKLIEHKTDVTTYWFNNGSSGNRQHLTAETLASVYGELGFTADKLVANSRFFPNARRNENTIWGDCVAVEKDGNVYLPTLPDETTASFDVYYLPKQTVTQSVNKEDPTTVSENTFYTVTVNKGEQAEVKYFLNRTNAVVTVDNAPKGKAWICTGADGSVVDSTVAQQTTFTINNIAQAYTVKLETALDPVAAVVAQDGAETTYNTLHEAFANAQAGQTIKLLTNVTFGEKTEETAAIEVSKKLVFDLNGYTVAGAGAVFTVNENGDMTVQDSTATHAGKIVGLASAGDLEAPKASAISALSNAKVAVESGEVWGVCAPNIDGNGELNAIYVDTNAVLNVSGNAVVGAVKAENNALNTAYPAVDNAGTVVVTDNAKIVGVQAGKKVTTKPFLDMNVGQDAIYSTNSLTVSGDAQIIGVVGEDVADAEARAIQAYGDLVLEGGRMEGKGQYGSVLTADTKLVIRASEDGKIPVLENTDGPALTMSKKYPGATQNITAGIFKIPAVSEKFTDLKAAVAKGYTAEQGNLAEDKWAAAADGAYLKVVDQFFSVSFKNGDQVVDTRTIRAGDALGQLPTASEKKDFVFKGWMDANGKAVTAKTIVESDMVITAKYNELFDVTIEGKTYQVEEGETIGDRLPADPTKEGYTFECWKDQNGNVVTKATVVSGDLKVTASWTKNAKPNPPAPDGGNSTPEAGGNNNKPAAGGATATGDTTNLLSWMTLAGLMAAGAALSFKKLRGTK